MIIVAISLCSINIIQQRHRIHVLNMYCISLNTVIIIMIIEITVLMMMIMILIIMTIIMIISTEFLLYLRTLILARILFEFMQGRQSFSSHGFNSIKISSKMKLCFVN